MCCSAPSVEPVNLGSLADIITALTAIGALFAAIVGAKHAARLFAVEAKRDKNAAARERQAQASRVFAWVAARMVDGEAAAYGAVVVNSSDQAIYDVMVRVVGANGVERTPIKLAFLPPGSFYLEESVKAFAWNYPSRLRSFEDEIRPLAKSKKRYIAGMWFRDSSNLNWTRDETGILVAQPV